MIQAFLFMTFLGAFTAVVAVAVCYERLGSPTFFLYPALSAIPFSMGHDN